MSFFKKRSGAVLAAVVIIILSSFFAANRSLNVKVREINDLFSDGVYDSSVGYKQKSIKSQLDVRASASLNLISIGASYGDASKETERLRDARSVLVNGLSKNVGADKLYGQNSDLQTAFDALYTKLNTLALDSNARSIADESKGRMTGAASMIEKSGYNEAVREFNRKVLSVFPTNFIKDFALVKSPELFE
jgi:hypothetical protein